MTKYVYGHGLIGEEKQDLPFKVYHFDYRGSTAAITDANGNPVSLIDPFGLAPERGTTSYFNPTLNESFTVDSDFYSVTTDEPITNPIETVLANLDKIITVEGEYWKAEVIISSSTKVTFSLSMTGGNGPIDINKVADLLGGKVELFNTILAEYEKGNMIQFGLKYSWAFLFNDNAEFDFSYSRIGLSHKLKFVWEEELNHAFVHSASLEIEHKQDTLPNGLPLLEREKESDSEPNFEWGELASAPALDAAMVTAVSVTALIAIAIGGRPNVLHGSTSKS